MKKVYVIPDKCPVDNDEVIILIRKSDEELVFYCSLCGNAWEELEHHKINNIRELAPSGVRLATEDDIKKLDLIREDIQELDYTEMYGSLDEILEI